MNHQEQRIAELYGVVEILEILLVRILVKDPVLDEGALIRHIDQIVRSREECCEGEWSNHSHSGLKDAAKRIRTALAIRDVLATASDRGAPSPPRPSPPDEFAELRAG